MVTQPDMRCREASSTAEKKDGALSCQHTVYATWASYETSTYRHEASTATFQILENANTGFGGHTTQAKGLAMQQGSLCSSQTVCLACQQTTDPITGKQPV